jgi:hypothetical protein
MIDVPQHAAQISIWSHFDDPCYRFADTYEFNWSTPYLFGYVLIRCVAAILPVDRAVEVAIYLAVVTLPLAIRSLLRHTEGDRWLSLLGFPLAFGFTFYWGFVNYLIAIPVAVFYLTLAYELSSRTHIGRAVLLACVSVLLLVSHALIFLYCAAAATALALFVRPRRHAAVLLIPAALPVPALIWWVGQMRGSESLVRHPIGWNLGIYRLMHLPSVLLSDERDTFAIVFVLFVVAAIAVSGARPTADARRWVFFALAAVIYFCGPQSAFGTAFLFHRFAVFVAIGLLFVLHTKGREMPAWSRALIVIAVISWCSLLAVRFHRFDGEASEFDAILSAIPANRRIASYTAYPNSEAVPGAVFLHFPAYYQERKGGVTSWSFATFFPQLIRYRAGAAPKLGGSVLFDPAHLDWEGLSTFDYVVIRARRDPTPALAAKAPYPLFPTRRSGMWWLYATPRGRAARDSCPPLE